MYKYGQELPKELEDKLDAYIERIKRIKWFKPSKDLNKDEVEKQAKLALECFGVKASIEYRSLKTKSDWDEALDEARDAAFDEALDSAWDAARYAARDEAWDAALDAVFYAILDSALYAALYAVFGASCGAADIVSSDLYKYKYKYPNGSFINLIPLYEMGLYPVGVLKETGTFVIYIPE